MATPQFGEPRPDLAYADRPAAFGVLERAGSIALVRVTKPGHPAWLDLPGGAVDPGESDSQALVREFGEETGLAVAAGRILGRADQFFINTDGGAYNNRAALFEATCVREAAHLKIEEDHELVWFSPLEALSRLRHDSHAWAVAAWLRTHR
ncbi:MAG: NUDIX domain-containing protein [Caulobacterales bacterium]